MKKLGVLFVHGMGFQAPGYSDTFRTSLEQLLGPTLSSQIAFGECYWKGKMSKRQKARWYTMNTGSRLLCQKLREFVVMALGDPIGYLGVAGKASSYILIHEEVRSSLANLELQIDDDSLGKPVVVLAHSMGSAIISNYIWDQNHPDPNDGYKVYGQTPFEKLDSLVVFVSYGSTIPLFTLDIGELMPIEVTANSLPLRIREKVAWLNFFGRADVLAYPMSGIWTNRTQGAAVTDIPVVLSKWYDVRSWGPFGHQHIYYESSRIVQKEVCGRIADLLGEPNHQDLKADLTSP